MSFLDSIKSLLTLKSDALLKLEQENDNLKDSVDACHLALRHCDEHSLSLEQDILALQTRIERLKVVALDPENYYEWARIEVGEITRHTGYWAIVRDDLKALGIRWICEAIEDSEAFYVDQETLVKMIPFLSYPSSYASPEWKVDCGDMAMWAAADASKIFHVNGVIQIWGKTPYKPPDHAWCGLQVAEGNYMCWEPDKGLAASGQLFDIVNNQFGYRAERWR